MAKVKKARVNLIIVLIADKTIIYDIMLVVCSAFSREICTMEAGQLTVIYNINTVYMGNVQHSQSCL